MYETRPQRRLRVVVDLEAVPVQSSDERSPRGLETVYREAYADLVRLGYLLTSSHEAAVDLCHDAFLGAQGRWATIDHPRAYLRQSVVRGAAGYHRRKHREDRALRRLASSTPAVSSQDEFVLDLISRLPYRQQAVVVLRFWSDLSERQIAEAVGCREGSVGPTLTRALRKMRTALEEGR
jgi:RNA polymerase sigma factor (sigma-70 family)